MSTAQYSLCKVLTRSFCDGRPPVDIPPYQRPYRWSISEVRKLLEDLDSFRYNPGTKSYDESAQYYYGTICFDAHDGKLELIDGQQRLTTALLLDAVLRHKLGGAACTGLEFTITYDTREPSSSLLVSLIKNPDQANTHCPDAIMDIGIRIAI